MADEQDQATGRPSGGRRWLRWGSVYVDIEPPAAPNPWTTPGWGAPVADAPPPAPARPSRRPMVLFALAAVVAALVGFLLVAAFTRNDRTPILTVSTSTTRPRVAPTTTAAARPTTPPTTTGGSTTTPSTRPAGGTSTTASARPGGPITIPEGLPPSSAAAPVPTTAPPSTLAPTTTTTVEPTAFLGVTVEDTFDGVQIVDVLPGTGAEAAGLAQGDIITALDATPVANLEELGAAIDAHQPGDSVTVTVQRGAGTVTVRATLGRR